MITPELHIILHVIELSLTLTTFILVASYAYIGRKRD